MKGMDVILNLLEETQHWRPEEIVLRPYFQICR